MGIPHGSVLSPFLCNIYTRDAMREISCNHTEFADDGAIWSSGDAINQVMEDISDNIDRVADKWCAKWNMGIAADKTESIVIKPHANFDTGGKKVHLKGIDLKTVKKKKMLGVVIDDELTFHQHISEKTKSGFKALNSITHFGHDRKGCSQEIFTRLYKALVLPVLDYGSPILAANIELAEKEFGKVQRKALLTATGCMASTATDQLEVMTGTLPISLHLKKKNAEELTRMHSKTDRHPIKQDLQHWLEEANGTNACILKHLLSQFNELKGKVDLDHIEEDFRYTKEGGLSMYRQVGYITEQEEYRNSKSQKADRIEDILQQIDESDICIFSDGSALGNPGPTGAGACLYMKGLNSDPIQLKRPVSPSCNNYVGELNGIHLGLDWLDSQKIKHKEIHLFVDCQPAIRTIFSTTMPDANIALVVECRQMVKSLDENNKLSVHWIPGHKGIQGNEIADKLAKEAAAEMVGKPEEVYSRKITKKELSAMMKTKANEKWQRRYENTSSNENFDEIYPKVVRKPTIKRERTMEVLINQLQTGHCKLNYHMSKIDSETSAKCDHCNVSETVKHLLFDCDEYETARNIMMRKVGDLMHQNQTHHPTITLKPLLRQEEEGK